LDFIEHGAHRLSGRLRNGRFLFAGQQKKVFSAWRIRGSVTLQGTALSRCPEERQPLPQEGSINQRATAAGGWTEAASLSFARGDQLQLLEKSSNHRAVSLRGSRNTNNGAGTAQHEPCSGSRV